MTESPLVLAIFGPPGEGKTFQTEFICRELGVQTYIISPGELESENAGHPAQILRQQYVAAGSAQPNGRPGVLIINDIDTVLGNWGDLVQYTVNRQIVYGQLMAFCDYPNEVAGSNTRRVPIILTGNNPSIMYGPLLRPGRTRIIKWAPDVATRIPIVQSILPTLQVSEVGRLVESYSRQPVSFWSDVRAAIWEQGLVRWISTQPVSALNRLLRDGRRLTLGDGDWDFESIRSTAYKLDSDRTTQKSFVTNNTQS
jgi:ATP-dependent 26S proteasome regulatory subunit